MGRKAKKRNITDKLLIEISDDMNSKELTLIQYAVNVLDCTPQTLTNSACRPIRSYNYSPIPPYYLNTLIPYYLCPAHIRIVSFCRGTAVGRKRQGLNYNLLKFFRAADYGIFGSVSNRAFPVLSRRMP